MNILNLVSSQSNLELVVVAFAVVVALRVITAISYKAGRKAGQAAVFSAMKALDDAQGATRRADAAVIDSRKWLEVRKEESAKVERQWQKFTYEHRSYVAEQLAYAEASLERALKAQRDVEETLNSAREALEALK